MPFVLNESEGVSRIHVQGEIDIASAEELKTLLLEALSSEKELQVEIAEATDLDVTVIQLLYAAHRDAAKARKKFTFVGALPDTLALSLADGGFQNLPFKS